MKQFTIELVSNASMSIYPKNSLSSFCNFLPEQFNFSEAWEVALLEISYPNLYHNITDGRFRYKHDGNDDKIDIITIPSGLYTSLHQILQTMQEAAKGIYPDKKINLEWEINVLNQKVIITLPNPKSALNIISKDLAHILGFPESFILFGNKPKESIYPIDILRVHSLMVYTDIIEHGIIGDTRAPLLRCFPFIPKLKNDEIVTNQYMNYRAFDKLLFKKLTKRNFHSITIELRDTTGELVPFVAVGVTRLTLLFKQNH